MDSIFEFELFPIAEIIREKQSQGNSEVELTWGALSQGVFRLRLGDQSLFCYLPQEVRSVAFKVLPDRVTWEQGQVSQLWEATLNILSRAIHPVPDHLIDELNPDSPTFPILAGETEKLMRLRKLELLERHPNIWIWSLGDVVTITWQSDLQENKTSVWSARDGSFSMERDDFIRHVTDFHEDFIDQMRERVLQLSLSISKPGIRLNLTKLRDEQSDRKRRLSLVLNQVV